MEIKKTNAVRILDKRGCRYSLHPYEVDDDDLSGETVARKIGADPDSVFKTLIARGESGGIFVFCIPVTAELHLKKAARAAGEKNIAMVKMNELLALTGYIRGGCSPIGMKKDYPVFIDETAQLFDSMYCSAGVRGLQVQLAPDELLAAAGGSYADLI